MEFEKVWALNWEDIDLIFKNKKAAATFCWYCLRLSHTLDTLTYSRYSGLFQGEKFSSTGTPREVPRFATSDPVGMTRSGEAGVEWYFVFSIYQVIPARIQENKIWTGQKFAAWLALVCAQGAQPWRAVKKGTGFGWLISRNCYYPHSLR